MSLEKDFQYFINQSLYISNREIKVNIPTDVIFNIIIIRYSCKFDKTINRRKQK